jgi:hypothetical protein
VCQRPPGQGSHQLAHDTHTGARWELVLVTRRVYRAAARPGPGVTLGRRIGETRRSPLTLIDRDGHLYLVAPYGPVGWVVNPRAPT